MVAKPMASYRILFVCMGNICRSPAAEGVFRAKISGEDWAEVVEVDSAGTISIHTGEPADGRMRAAAGKRGYVLESRARGLRKEDFAEFDLILAMDRSNYRDIERLQPRGETRAQVGMFCDYCREHAEKEVPDPYYGGDQGFELVLDLLEDGCRELARQVRERVIG